MFDNFIVKNYVISIRDRLPLLVANLTRRPLFNSRLKGLAKIDMSVIEIVMNGYN